MDLTEFKMIEHPEIAENKYMINKNGEVYSLFINRLMKPKFDSCGYKLINLQKRESGNKNKKLWYIHKLVMMTYIGDPPIEIKKPTIDHIDGNRINNNINNLRYMEWSQNAGQRHTSNRGENNGRTKIKRKRYFKNMRDV